MFDPAAAEEEEDFEFEDHTEGDDKDDKKNYGNDDGKDASKDGKGEVFKLHFILED